MKKWLESIPKSKIKMRMLAVLLAFSLVLPGLALTHASMARTRAENTGGGLSFTDADTGEELSMDEFLSLLGEEDNNEGGAIGIDPFGAQGIQGTQVYQGIQTGGPGFRPNTNFLAVNLPHWTTLAAARSVQVTITANTSWTARSDAPWLRVFPMSGQGTRAITLTTENNTSASARHATVTVLSGGLMREITITQEGTGMPTDVYFYHNRDHWDVPETAESMTMTITANVPWTITGGAPWLTIWPINLNPAYDGNYNGTFVIDAEANMSATPRQALITMTGGGIIRQVWIRQAGTATRLTLDIDNWQASNQLSNRTVDIDSNMPWTATVSANATWMSLNVLHNEGSGYSGRITMTVQPNTTPTQRTGTVTITGGGVTRTITVTQAAAVTLLLNMSTWNPHAVPSNTAVSVTANVAWTVTTSEPWLTTTVAMAGGNNYNGSIIVSATENELTSTRSGTVTVSGGGVQRTIEVTQRGAEVALSLSRSTWAPSLFAQSISVQVTSNVNWRTSVSEDANWLSVTPNDGRNDGVIVITVMENTTEVPRTATVYVTGGNLVRTVVVTQAPPTLLTLNRSSWAAHGHAPDYAIVTVTSNVTWTASSSESWLTITNVWNNEQVDVGMFVGNFRMNVPTNPTTTARTATVTVTGGGMTRTIAVTQAGAPIVLNLSQYNWHAPATAAHVVINVTSNHAWSVQAEP